jgi:hypothetical protein
VVLISCSKSNRNRGYCCFPRGNNESGYLLFPRGNNESGYRLFNVFCIQKVEVELFGLSARGRVAETYPKDWN